MMMINDDLSIAPRPTPQRTPARRRAVTPAPVGVPVSDHDDARYRRYDQLAEARRAAWRQLSVLSDLLEENDAWGHGLGWLGGAAVAVFSCRVECPGDALRFMDAAHNVVRPHRALFCVRLFQDDAPFYGVLEFKTTLAADALRALLDAIPDTHVMVETLRPCALADNCLERVRPYPLTLDPKEPDRLLDEEAAP